MNLSLNNKEKVIYKVLCILLNLKWVGKMQQFLV